VTSSRAGWLVVAVLAGSQFLAVMSTTVVSVALPATGAGRHASAAGRLWIVDAYVIVYSALLVVGGTIGDRRARRYYLRARDPRVRRRAARGHVGVRASAVRGGRAGRGAAAAGGAATRGTSGGGAVTTLRSAK